MPVPDHLAAKPFSFYPPILNVEHNEWVFRRETWSEMLVANTKAGFEVWIPRRLVGEISSVEEPVMIIGLLKELEYKGGSVWPREKRVIVMPSTGQTPKIEKGEAAGEPAPISAESGSPSPPAERRMIKMIVAALVAGVAITFLVVKVGSRDEKSGVGYSTREQVSLGLTRRDDYFAVVRKLGAPAGDRWQSAQGVLQYRILSYPGRSCSVILMGRDRKEARYAGAMDRDWKVIDSVELPGGGDTTSLLRALPRF